MHTFTTPLIVGHMTDEARTEQLEKLGEELADSEFAIEHLMLGAVPRYNLSDKEQRDVLMHVCQILQERLAEYEA